MQLATQVIARNTKPQVVVLSSDAKGSEFVEWQPADDPSGGDIQVIPDVIANSAAFTRLVSRGVVVIEQADEAYQAAMDKQRLAFEGRLNGAANKASQALVPENQNDLLSVPCIGPDARGAGNCNVPVPVREKTKDERPPLCPQHEHLAAQYVSYEDQQGTQIVKKWSRATLTERERQQA